jgi:diguanylate cyclase (GGDEF)-like protein/PAS domain S-box-containing protein
MTESRRLLSAVLDTSCDAIVATTPAGIVTSWNRAAERIFGYAPHEIVGSPADVLVPAHRAGETLTVLAQVFADGREARVETERVAKDGSLVPVRLTLAPIEDDAGGLVGLCAISTDLTERKGLEGEIDYLSRHDRLTGLYSRREFEHALRRQLPYSRRYGSGGAVVLLGVDGLSLVNLNFSRSAGNEMLVHIGRLLIDRLRATDTIARFGGDNFAVLLPEADEQDAYKVADDLLERVRTHPAVLDGRPRWITCSAGIACFDNALAPSAEQLIAIAETALRAAKRSGRDRAVVGGAFRSLQLR